MSKPRPFINSLWGIAFVLLLAIIVLGVNNYRGHQAGFNLTFHSNAVMPINKQEANTFQLVNTAEDFAKLAKPTEPISIDWTKQLALVYFSSAQPTSDYQIQPLTVHRESTTINISYQILPPAADAKVTRTISYPGVAILIDRARLISSSNLLINLMQNKTVTNSLIISPNQI